MLFQSSTAFPPSEPVLFGAILFQSSTVITVLLGAIIFQSSTAYPPTATVNPVLIDSATVTPLPFDAIRFQSSSR